MKYLFPCFDLLIGRYKSLLYNTRLVTRDH